jgi:GNAT superfamily N-acetyltransferase
LRTVEEDLVEPHQRAMAKAGQDKVDIRPLTAARVDDVKTVTRGTWGATCWDLFPRFSAREQRAMGITNQGRRTEKRRRAVLARLARRQHSAGLVAYEDREPIGFVSLGPRLDFSRIASSRATPPVDEVDAWVIPCITVRRGHRGKGVAVAMIRAAVDHAGAHGARAVEAYPRAGDGRVHDDLAFIGTEELFQRAGFRRIRGVLPGLPKGWARRVTMRIACRARPSARSRATARPKAVSTRSHASTRSRRSS